MLLNGDLDIPDLFAPGPLNVGYQCCEMPGWSLLAVKLAPLALLLPIEASWHFRKTRKGSSISTVPLCVCEAKL